MYVKSLKIQQVCVSRQRSVLNNFALVFFSNVVNESGEVKPRSLRFTWSMKTTSSRDPNEIMAEIKKVSSSLLFIYSFFLFFKLTIDLQMAESFMQSTLQAFTSSPHCRYWTRTTVTTSRGRGSCFYASTATPTLTRWSSGRLKCASSRGSLLTELDLSVSLVSFLKFNQYCACLTHFILQGHLWPPN